MTRLFKVNRCTFSRADDSLLAARRNRSRMITSCVRKLFSDLPEPLSDPIDPGAAIVSLCISYRTAQFNFKPPLDTVLYVRAATKRALLPPAFARSRPLRFRKANQSSAETIHPEPASHIHLTVMAPVLRLHTRQLVLYTLSVRLAVWLGMMHYSLSR